MISLKRIFCTCCLLLSVWAVFAQGPSEWKALEKPLNFYLANDLGRNGYYDQKPIAELMGQMAENVDIEAVVAAGDVHHFEGVRSGNDHLWMTSFELVYSHPELMIPWNPSRHYTNALENDDFTVRLGMIDTAPLLDKYRKDTEKYPDACKQDMDKQLAWLDSVLTSAKEDWVLVVGHHPIYADTDKNDSERLDMEKRVDSILRKHNNVNMYLCGHIHNFQHIRKAGSKIDYVVNTSASLSRKVKAVEGTVFCSGETGFSLISADKKELCLYMINKEGKVLHTVRQTR